LTIRLVVGVKPRQL